MLVDFWTYTCINCIRTLPYIEAWYRKYHRDGFTVVGVHTPEFPFEKDASNVAAGDRRLRPHLSGRPGQRLRHLERLPQPVLAGGLPDRCHGRVRLVHFGEGSYDGDRAGRSGACSPRPGPAGSGRWRTPAPRRPDPHATPESYLGAARADAVRERRDPARADRASDAVPHEPSSAATSSPTAASGRSAARRQPPADDASLELDFNARRVFLVLGSPGQPPHDAGAARRQADPDSLAGPDVHGGVATISNQRLYRLVDLPRPGEHVLTLRPQAGIAGYAFTFG